MLAASFIAIFLIPMTFYVVEKLSHRGDSPKGTARARTHTDPHQDPQMSQKGGEHA